MLLADGLFGQAKDAMPSRLFPFGQCPSRSHQLGFGVGGFSSKFNTRKLSLPESRK